jgi:predicted transposase/invertase (TIGR01784 family)
MTDLTSPHDHFFRHSLRDIKVAKESLERFLPKELLAQLQLDTLSSCEGSFVNSELKLRVVDKLFSVKFVDDSNGYLYILYEHQSTPDHLMAFRSLQYRVAIWDYHLEQTKDQQLPPIHVVVFYNGQVKWNCTSNLLNLVRPEHREKVRLMLEQAYEFVNVHQIPDDELRQQTKLNLMLMALKKIFIKDVLSVIEEFAPAIISLTEKGEHEYIKTLMIYLLREGSIKNPNGMLDLIKKKLPVRVGGELMNTMMQYIIEQALQGNPEITPYFMEHAEQLRQKGRIDGMREGIREGMREGIREGKQEGKFEMKQEIARKMLSRKLPVEMIAEITGLSLTEIQRELDTTENTHLTN